MASAAVVLVSRSEDKRGETGVGSGKGLCFFVHSRHLPAGSCCMACVREACRGTLTCQCVCPNAPSARVTEGVPINNTLSGRSTAGAGEIQRNSSLAPGQVADADGAAREKGRGGVSCAACTPRPRKVLSRVLVPCRWWAPFPERREGICAAGDMLGKFGMESIQDESAKVRRDDTAHMRTHARMRMERGWYILALLQQSLYDTCMHSAEDLCCSNVQRAPPNATRALTSSHARAQIIQHAALPRLIGDKTALRRKALLERVQLELELQRGLRLLMLCLCMFAGNL